MKRKTILPSREVLSQIFSYDPETGELRWIKRPREQFSSNNSWSKFNSQMCGSIVGTKQYRKSGEPSCIMVRFRVSKTNYATPATAIIFSMQKVEIPQDYQVDHKDRDPFNNRWLNLRLATAQQNSFNQISTRKNHALPRGVYRIKRGFRAMIAIDGKTTHLGCFPTIELAQAAYTEKALEIQGEFHCPLWKGVDRISQPTPNP